MENKFRFYTNNKMEVLTWDELFKDARPDLVGVPVMQAFNIQVSDEPLFSGDILELDVTGFAENKLFWRSNLGQSMKEKGFEQLVVHVKTSQYQELAFDCYFKRNGQFITENEYDNMPKDDPDYAKGEGAFCTSDTGNMFIRYVIKNGAVVVGNSHQHPELLPVPINA